MKHSSPFPVTGRRRTKAALEAEAARQRGYQITLEFRVKRNGVLWEDAAVHGTYTLDERDAHITAGHIAQYLADREGEEVRWNVVGSKQGHFRQPQGGTHEFARAVLGAKPVHAEVDLDFLLPAHLPSRMWIANHSDQTLKLNLRLDTPAGPIEIVIQDVHIAPHTNYEWGETPV